MLKTKINISDIITNGGTVNIPLNLSFSPETQQYDFIEKNFEEVKNGYINETIDYEKVKLSPHYEVTHITQGEISYTYKGEWREDLPYSVNDVTLHNENYYILNVNTTEITKTMAGTPDQATIELNETGSDLRVGMLVKEIGGSGDISDFNIRIVSINDDNKISFNQDVYEYFAVDEDMIFLTNWVGLLGEWIIAYDSNNFKKIYSIKINPHFFIDNNWTTENTKILDIGFTNDDVIYRRKRVDNSFLRLLFYDSPDPKTQNLLYFSIVFLDGGDLYSKYLQSGSTSGLSCEFIVEDPKYTNELRTSEGFFTYLFKDDFINSDIKTIYLKIEFNNASDGNITLFTKTKPTGVGYTIKELYENMYFKIYCKYDTNINNYVYWFDDLLPEISNSPNKKIKNVLNIEIYQARLL